MISGLSRNAVQRQSSTDPAASRRRLVSLWRERGGATAVEMAFLLPVFFLFVFGIIEFARVVWTQTALQFASEAAARCAVVSPSSCTAPGGSSIDVPAYAASQTMGVSIPSTAFTYTQNANATANCTATQNIGTGGAMVKANYAFDSIATQLVPLNITLSACSYHP